NQIPRYSPNYETSIGSMPKQQRRIVRWIGLIAILTAITANGTFFEGALGALGPTIQIRFQIHDSTIGYLISVIYLIAGLLAPFAMRVISAIQIIPTTFVLLSICVLALIISAHAVNFWQFAISMAILGIPLAL